MLVHQDLTGDIMGCNKYPHKLEFLHSFFRSWRTSVNYPYHC